MNEAQEITGKLFLGPITIAQSQEALASLGITHVLSILGPEQGFESVAVSPENRYQCEMMDNVDAEGQMRLDLPFALAKLNEWRNLPEHTGTLVHCQQGILRSATVCLAFMMQNEGMRLMEAYKHVFERRPFIKPNAKFFVILQEFEANLLGREIR